MAVLQGLRRPIFLLELETDGFNQISREHVKAIKFLPWLSNFVLKPTFFEHALLGLEGQGTTNIAMEPSFSFSFINFNDIKVL